MSMLNTQLTGIKANGRMSLCRTSNGQVFSLGKDFRENPQSGGEKTNGVPRLLKVGQVVTQMAIGRDHAVIVTADSALYTFGANQFGQLGISASTIPKQIEENKKRIAEE